MCAAGKRSSEISSLLIYQRDAIVIGVLSGMSLVGAGKSPWRNPPYPWVTEAGVAGFFLVAGFMIVLRDDLDPVLNYISEYAVGPGGWGMQIGFALLAVGSLNLTVGFFRSDQSPNGGRRVGTFLGLWTIAVIIAGAFRVDLQGTPITTVGVVHLLASLVGFVALTIGMAIAGFRFRANDAWQPLAKPTLVVAVLTALAFVLEVSLFSSLGWVGVGQWLLFIVAGGWLAGVGWQFSHL